MTEQLSTRKVLPFSGIAAFIVLLIAIACAAPHAQASSYPMHFPEKLLYTQTAGEKVVVTYTIFPKYHNEKITFNCYDSNGNSVMDTVESSFYNLDGDSYSRPFTFTLNTKGMKPGTYTLESQMSFYSMFEWHEAPSGIITTIKLTAPKVGVAKIKKLQSKRSGVVKAKMSKTKNSQGHQIKIATNKKFTKIIKSKSAKGKTIVVKGLKPGKKYYVKVRAYRTDGGKKRTEVGPRSRPSKCVSKLYVINKVSLLR